MRNHRQFVVATLLEISSDAQFTVGDDYESLRWHNQDIAKPTKEEFELVLAELKATEPIRLLRIERNRRLAETDWWAVADRTMTAEQTAYRTALRDLPATQEPQLDQNGMLTNITWPEVPE